MTPRAVPLAAAAVLGVAVLACAATGCGGAAREGGLESAGPTPAAVGPVRLWPDLPPATNPPLDYGETDTERVPGVEVADNDVRGVDPVAVVRAEVRAAGPDTYTGADGMDEETARAIASCPTPAGPGATRPDAPGATPPGAPSPGAAACPVMKPYYRDLTGNGRDELIVGIRMPDQQVGVRVYLAENGGLTRIMSTVDQVISVEVAGRDLITRAGSAGIPGYEYRTAWSWDAQQHSMLPTRDEIVRVRPSGAGPSTVPAPHLVSPSATTTPPPAPGSPEPAPPEPAP